MKALKPILLTLMIVGIVLGFATGSVNASPADKSIPVVRYKTVKVDGLDIFYREAGDRSKPAILLLHGFPTSSFMFRELIPQLADRFYLVAPDYPGFGQSSMPAVGEFDYTFENLANVVDKFTEVVGISKYSLYLQDYGSPVGFRLAVKHPDRIQALIIQNGNAYESGIAEFASFLKTYGETRDPETTELIRNFLKLEGVKYQYVHGARDLTRISPDTWTHDVALLNRQGNTDIQLALVADYASNVKQYPIWHEYFRQNQPPTLVVWGKNDPIFTVAGVEEGYKRDLKDIEVTYFDGGHFVLEEYGTEVASKIKQFFRKRSIR